MTRKIVFKYEVGYAGMDGIDFFEYPDDVTDEQLYKDAHEGAVQHAESYGYYLEEDMPEDYDEESEGDWRSDQYSSNIEGWFEDYNPEKHDGQVPGGGLPRFQ